MRNFEAELVIFIWKDVLLLFSDIIFNCWGAEVGNLIWFIVVYYFYFYFIILLIIIAKSISLLTLQYREYLLDECNV